eukprot:g2455.t1
MDADLEIIREFAARHLDEKNRDGGKKGDKEKKKDVHEEEEEMGAERSSKNSSKCKSGCSKTVEILRKKLWGKRAPHKICDSVAARTLPPWWKRPSRFHATTNEGSPPSPTEKNITHQNRHSSTDIKRSIESLEDLLSSESGKSASAKLVSTGDMDVICALVRSTVDIEADISLSALNVLVRIVEACDKRVLKENFERSFRSFLWAVDVDSRTNCEELYIKRCNRGLRAFLSTIPTHASALKRSNNSSSSKISSSSSSSGATAHELSEPSFVAIALNIGLLPFLEGYVQRAVRALGNSDRFEASGASVTAGALVFDMILRISLDNSSESETHLEYFLLERTLFLDAFWILVCRAHFAGDETEMLRFLGATRTCENNESKEKDTTKEESSHHTASVISSTNTTFTSVAGRGRDGVRKNAIVPAVASWAFDMAERLAVTRGLEKSSLFLVLFFLPGVRIAATLAHGSSPKRTLLVKTLLTDALARMRKSCVLTQAVSSSRFCSLIMERLSFVLFGDIETSCVVTTRQSDDDVLQLAGIVRDMFERIASYAISASTLRSMMFRVLRRRWNFRTTRGLSSTTVSDDENSTNGLACDKLLVSMMNAACIARRENGGYWGTCELRFPSSVNPSVQRWCSVLFEPLRKSALQLADRNQQPGILRSWPVRAHYSVSVWFRLDDTIKDANCVRSLCRLRDASGRIAFDCTIRGGRTVCICTGEDSESQRVSFDLPRVAADLSAKDDEGAFSSTTTSTTTTTTTNPCPWRHVVISHASSGTLFGRKSSTLVAYVDGLRCFEESVPFPPNRAMSILVVGGSAGKSEWALGPLNIFEARLEERDALALWAAGPSYRGDFSESDTRGLPVFVRAECVPRLTALEHSKKKACVVRKTSAMPSRVITSFNSTSVTLRIVVFHRNGVTRDARSNVYLGDAKGTLSTWHVRRFEGREQDSRMSSQRFNAYERKPYIWAPRPWISCLWTSCFGAVPLVLALVEWGASVAPGMTLDTALLLLSVTCSGDAGVRSAMERENAYAIVSHILASKIDLKEATLTPNHVSTLFDIVQNRWTDRSAREKSASRLTRVGVVRREVRLFRNASGRLNVGMDQTNIVRSSHTQPELHTGDRIVKCEENDIDDNQSAFLALKDFMSRFPDRKSFRVTVLRNESPPLLANFPAFEHLILRWHLWRSLPTEFQRLRLRFIASVIAGTHPNAVRNREVLYSKNASVHFMEHILIPMSDPTFDMILLPEVLSLISDHIFGGSASTKDFECLAGFVASTLSPNFVKQKSRNPFKSRRHSFLGRSVVVSPHSRGDSTASSSHLGADDNTFVNFPFFATEVRIGLLKLLCDLANGILHRKTSAEKTDNVNMRQHFIDVFHIDWALTVMKLCCEDINVIADMVAIREAPPGLDPADSAVMALRMLVALTPLQWHTISPARREIFMGEFVLSIERTWRCTQRPRVLSMMLRMLLMLFIGVAKDPLPVRYGRRGSSMSVERKITVYRDQTGSMGIIIDANFNIVSVTTQARRFGLRVGQRIVRVEGKRVSTKSEIERIFATTTMPTVNFVVQDSDPDASCDNLMKATLETAQLVSSIERPDMLWMIFDILVKVRDDAVVQCATTTPPVALSNRKEREEDATKNAIEKRTYTTARRNLELVVACLQTLMALFQIVPGATESVWGGSKADVDRSLALLQSLFANCAWEESSGVRVELETIKQTSLKLLAFGTAESCARHLDAIQWLQSVLEIDSGHNETFPRVTPMLKRSRSAGSSVSASRFLTPETTSRSPATERSVSMKRVQSLRAKNSTPLAKNSDSKRSLSARFDGDPALVHQTKAKSSFSTPSSELVSQRSVFRDKMEKLMTEFYAAVNPQKLSKATFVTGVLTQYRGYEDVLVNRLSKRYKGTAANEMERLQSFVKTSQVSGLTPRYKSEWATKARSSYASPHSLELLVEGRDCVREWMPTYFSAVISELRDKVGPRIEDKVGPYWNLAANIIDLASTATQFLGASQSSCLCDVAIFIIWWLERTPVEKTTFFGGGKISRTRKQVRTRLFSTLRDVVATLTRPASRILLDRARAGTEDGGDVEEGSQGKEKDDDEDENDSTERFMEKMSQSLQDFLSSMIDAEDTLFSHTDGSSELATCVLERIVPIIAQVSAVREKNESARSFMSIASRLLCLVATKRWDIVESGNLWPKRNKIEIAKGFESLKVARTSQSKAGASDDGTTACGRVETFLIWWCALSTSDRLGLVENMRNIRAIAMIERSKDTGGGRGRVNSDRSHASLSPTSHDTGLFLDVREDAGSSVCCVYTLANR